MLYKRAVLFDAHICTIGLLNIAFTKWLNHILAPIDDHGRIAQHDGKNGMFKATPLCKYCTYSVNVQQQFCSRIQIILNIHQAHPHVNYVSIFTCTHFDTVFSSTTSIQLSDSSASEAKCLNESQHKMSINAYRILLRQRRAACLLYQSEPILLMIPRLEAEIESQQLCMRPDKCPHADVGIKHDILESLLHAYHPLWLRLGLEVHTRVCVCGGRCVCTLQSYLYVDTRYFILLEE